MKILYHHRTASADGQAVHIEELVSALRQLGHEVRVVGPAVVSGDKMGDNVDWVHRLKLWLPKPLYELMELAYSAVAYRRLVQAAREFQPDILYERYNLYMLAGVMLRRRFHLPMLLEVNSPLVEERQNHGGLGLPWLARWAEGTVWRAADYALPVTQVLAGYVEAYGVDKRKIVVLHNGINQLHFDEAPEHEAAKSTLGLSGALVLGFTGFVREWHGVDKVIRWLAASEVSANAHLLVVGDGPARPALAQLAGELGVAQRVTFTGVVPREQVPGYVAAFDIALQPAVVAYASPLKLFEYLALGCAIVAPDSANLREVLVDGQNALLFSADQAGALEAALTRLCRDEMLRNRLGRAARATIDEKELTWLDNARRISALGNRLIQAGAGRT